MMGLPKSEIEGRLCSELWPNQAAQYWHDDLEVIRTGRAKRNIIEPLVTRNGTRWLQTDKIPFLDAEGRVAGIIGFSVDITERKQAEEAIRALSLVDELTGLFNRRGFFALADQQLKISRRGGEPLFLIFADLDNLKSTNDTLGHLEGDRLLRDAAHILRATFRESDIIARIGGDEFVVLMIEPDGSQAGSFVPRLRRRIVRRNAGDLRSRLSLSIGVTRYDPKTPCTLEELIQRADALMYEEKRKKRGAH
jgi:diguanylate cyclase (GGDEF)-like protein/PAS domain S-box-containing protein